MPHASGIIVRRELLRFAKSIWGPSLRESYFLHFFQKSYFAGICVNWRELAGMLELA